MAEAAAARVDDPFGHSSAMNGVLIGLAVGAIIGTAILTGGVSLIAVGAAVAITGGAGLAGEAIGQTMDGPDTGEIKVGSPTVFMDGHAAAMTVIATGPCSKDSGPPVPVATGAATVLIHRQPAARVGEKMACSAVIRHGSSTIFIGGPSKEVIKPTPEVPTWLNNTMLAMVVGGTAATTLGIGLAYGLGAAVGSLAGGLGGGWAGGKLGGAAAAGMGFGATGQAVGGVIGSGVGGFLGGGAGFRGGQAIGNRIWTNPTTPTGVMLRQGTSGGPPAVIAEVNKMPPAFRDEYAQARAANWTRANGKTWWPPDDGAAAPPVRTTLNPAAPGDPPVTIDRYGKTDGSFMGQPGDGFEARAMPGAPSGGPNVYTVEKPTTVEQAPIAPWFDQPGGGMQYKLVDPSGAPNDYTVDDALFDGYLKDQGTP